MGNDFDLQVVRHHGNVGHPKFNRARQAKTEHENSPVAGKLRVCLTSTAGQTGPQPSGDCINILFVGW